MTKLISIPLEKSGGTVNIPLDAELIDVVAEEMFLYAYFRTGPMPTAYRMFTYEFVKLYEDYDDSSFVLFPKRLKPSIISHSEYFLTYKKR